MAKVVKILYLLLAAFMLSTYIAFIDVQEQKKET